MAARDPKHPPPQVHRGVQAADSRPLPRGKPLREIEEEYDLGHSTVCRWVKLVGATGSTRAADNRTPEEQRIIDLERENRQLKMEVDVLKQAALIFARK